MSSSKMNVDGMTVSTMFETHKNGERAQHFVSANIKLDPSVPIDEFPIYQLQAAYKVSVAAVHDALMRGAMTVEEANERIATYKNNYEALSAKIARPGVGSSNG